MELCLQLQGKGIGFDGMDLAAVIHLLVAAFAY
jgi:hypothetical protein